MKKQALGFLFFFSVLVVFQGWLHPLQVCSWGRGHFYVIGTGPAGPEMATVQALKTIKRMDVVICDEQHRKLFAKYIGEEPGLFDPWTGIWDYRGKGYPKLSNEEIAEYKVERMRLKKERVDRIKRLLAEGKDVGLLDSGNPCLFGPSHWYVEEFDPQDVVIIPGMGCDAAALAALGKSSIPAHDTLAVVQTYPYYLLGKKFDDHRAIKDMARHPSTMIFYMALWHSEKLFEALRAAFPPDMPCAVVYWAGYPDRQRILRGTVADMGQKIGEEKEKFMGLLIVGRFLEGKPYEKAIIRTLD